MPVPMPTPDPVTLEQIPATGIDEVRDLWISLAEHHWRYAPELAALATPVRPQQSWATRRKQYAAWAEEPDWLLLGARRGGDGRLIGYAAARSCPAESSWDFGERIGKLETLVVTESARGAGIGSLLFERVRQNWRDAGIGFGSVSVIAGNDPAVDFYASRGAVEFTRSFHFGL